MNKKKLSEETGQYDKFIFVDGAKKDPKDNRDYRIASVMAPVAIPAQLFELPENFPPKCQWTRGSCTSQGQAHHKERQEGKRISAPFIMAKSKEMEGNLAYGGYNRNTFAVVNSVGVCEDSMYPEPGPEMSWEEYIRVSRITKDCFENAKEYKSQSFWRVENHYDQIRQTLIQTNNSVVISMPWYREWNNPDSDGVISLPTSSSVGGHCVEICGFNDFKRRLKMKNSWGNGWGLNGYFYMDYDEFNKYVWDCWCSLDIPAEMPVDKRYGQVRNYTMEKATAFNPWLVAKLGRLPNNREISGLWYGKYSFDAIFRGKVKDIWLKITKTEAIKQGIIDKNENIK